jgi:16S rRNA (adenine1518-N6/adenine1519-N6)-dimethyltransferase
VPRPHLGQHFLHDKNILARIAAAVEPSRDDVILEIGPGKGDLTVQLLAAGARVIAIEKDRDLARELGTRNAERGTELLEVVEGDALTIDWHAVVPRSALPVPRFKVVGNIPYYITSPLIDKALTPPMPERVVFLVQAEVADRLVAPPGSKVYGGLSVGVQAVAQVERLFRVPAGAFRPAPKVASALVRLTPLADPAIAAEEVPAFRRFVTACFSQRRKQLRNVVAHAAAIDVGAAAAGLAELGLDATTRPEQLGVAEFVRLLRWASLL